MAKQPTTRFTPEPEDYDPIPHFHVMSNDVGYVPDPDNIGTHLLLSTAVEDMLAQVREYIDSLREREDDQEFISVMEDVTVSDELDAMDEQIMEFDKRLTEPEHLAKHGYWFALDGGMSVVELGVCVEDCDVSHV